MFAFSYDGGFSYDGNLFDAIIAFASFSLTSLFIFIGVTSFFTITYFAPTIVAYVRRHRNIFWIFIINLLGGVFIIGWMIAFIWSLTGNVRDKYDY